MKSLTLGAAYAHVRRWKEECAMKLGLFHHLRSAAIGFRSPRLVTIAAAFLLALAGCSHKPTSPTESIPPTPSPAPPANSAPSLTGLNVNDHGTLIALVTPVTLEVNATDSDGDALTATWNLGDGTTATATLSGGRATTTKVFNVGTFQPTVTISDGRGGTRVGTYASIAVETLTGRWMGTSIRENFPPATVILILTQNGSTIGGGGEEQHVEGSILHRDPLTVTGNITAPRTVTMKVIIVPPTGFISPTFTASSDLKELSTGNWAGPLDHPVPLTLIRQ